jgi:hypothetical protein
VLFCLSVAIQLASCAVRVVKCHEERNPFPAGNINQSPAGSQVTIMTDLMGLPIKKVSYKITGYVSLFSG